jgi:hypothetical protein
MGYRKFLACLLPLVAGAAHAQDERRVVSPDGQLEFRLFTIMPEGSGLNTLAYQVVWRGKPLIDTSYLGLNIHFQEPLLGENVGLSASKEAHEAGYNGLVADYLQNSSTGRRIGLEVRVWNDAVQFRYVVPKQFPLLDLLIEEEATQFHFAYDTAVSRPTRAALPYFEEVPGNGWVGIHESPLGGFPRMSLTLSDSHTMTSHLPDDQHDPGVAYIGVTPWTGPWRIIAAGPSRDSVRDLQMMQGLPH